MKHQFFAILAILFAGSCNTPHRNIRPTQELLEVYTQQSSYSDPGDFINLYANLPDSYSDICSLVKKQLIHPLEASDMQDILPEGRYIEDGEFLSVEEMLAELVQRDSNGLYIERKPENRLVVACYHHALLLASMLRSKGITVRLRAGFARYFEEKANVRFGHVICEVWDRKKQRWIWIDPDRKYVDLKRKQFELPPIAWQNFRNDQLPNVNYTAALMKGEQAILHILLLDHLYVMADDQLYWHIPDFLFARGFSLNSCNENEILVLDEIAKLLTEPDINFALLQKLYLDNTFIHAKEHSMEEFYEKMTGKSFNEIVND